MAAFHIKFVDWINRTDLSYEEGPLFAIFAKSGGHRIRCIYAAKKYLKQNGRKKEWAAHTWVAPDEALSHLAQVKWMRDNIPSDRIVVRIDSLLGMVAAVRDGIGVGLLLCILVKDEPDIVPLAEPIDELETDLWILTHPALKGVARVRALSDFLYTRLRANTNVN